MAANGQKADANGKANNLAYVASALGQARRVKARKRNRQLLGTNRRLRSRVAEKNVLTVK